MNNFNFFSDKEIQLLKNAKNNKDYLHLKNNSSLNREIMNVQKFNDLISMHNSWNASNFKMVLDKKPINFSQYSTQGEDLGFSKTSPDPEKVQNFIRKGASLVLNDIIYLSKNIKNFAIDLQKVTLGKCQANLYFSMQSHQAFGPHFDTHDVFALHCDGEKTWNIYETLEDNPINHPIFKSDLNERTEKAGKVIEQVQMKPGDLLYLPRGKFHDALASKNGAIHIAFGINYLKPIDIIQFIWEKLITNAFLRSDIREVKGKKEIFEINKKISSELKIILENEELLEPILNYYNDWSYKLIDYDLESVVSSGVNYDISKSVTVVKKDGNMLLIDGKNAVNVPKNYEAMTEFSFEQKTISIKNLKKSFPQLSMKEIDEFVQSMKNMKVFV